MPKLTDFSWTIKYSPDGGSIVQSFYIPALRCAKRYWRTTGYFSAAALSLAMRGLEGLIQNQGTMRLLVGCTLNPPEVEAIQRGEDLRQQIQHHLATVPLEPPDEAAHNALELLAWLIQHEILEVKVAIPCDAKRRPISNHVIFHEKAGIIEDADGNRIAFTGSINETVNGWLHNWESFHVFTSWATPDHVDAEETSFTTLWSDRSPNAFVVDVPQAMRDRLLQFAPPEGQLPGRVKETGGQYRIQSPEKPKPIPEPEPTVDPRAIVWSYIMQAPQRVPEGERVGEATSAVTPWPHQVRAFKRMWDRWPPKLLIADEVGLGKTIQGGLLLRQSWLSGRAKRILVMAPAAVLKQWQVELREKFNLNWPIYDGKALHWYPSPGFQGSPVKTVSREDWHKEPFVLVSSHLMRRRERAQELLEQADPWDLVVLDEAHHARRSGGIQTGNLQDKRPNRLLSLMQRLRNRTQGLVLLTATPMQVDPIEVWDLLQLLGLPAEWTAADFLRFFELAGKAAPSHEQLAYMARLFRASEQDFEPISDGLAKRLAPRQSSIKAKKILRALRSEATIPLRQLETDEREAAVHIMQAHTPVRTLISRHTRELLRQYYKAGKISTRIAERKVNDVFIDLSLAERQVYDAVEDYIATTYNNAAAGDRNAVGFVMTIYRRRLSSSFYALAQTLEDRLAKLQRKQLNTSYQRPHLEDDLPDEQLMDDIPDLEEAAQLELQTLNLEESVDLQDLLAKVSVLSIDTKAQRLKELLLQLQSDGYRQVIVFTQFTDTMDFLRQEVTSSLGLSVICFSGRGGEIQQKDGSWRVINREQTKQRFRKGEADIMLCTDAAAEGLNFQFCGALINYDMPWNPMRVEQRIGRIDRLGQDNLEIRIYNLHYENTVETDVYVALQERIEFFQKIVGRLQPILSRLPSAITNLVLSRREDRERDRQNLLTQIEEEATQAQQQGFDLDAVTEADLAELVRPEPAYCLQDLEKILGHAHLLPPGTKIERVGSKDFAYLAPGMSKAIRITTNPDFYDQHSDSVELWSPGSPLFPQPEFASLSSITNQVFHQVVAPNFRDGDI